MQELLGSLQEEMREAQVEVHDVLGRGAFGTVYRGAGSNVFEWSSSVAKLCSCLFPFASGESRSAACLRRRVRSVRLSLCTVSCECIEAGQIPSVVLNRLKGRFMSVCQFSYG